MTTALQTSALERDRPTWLIAVGKAAPGMARAGARVFAGALRDGVTIAPEGPHTDVPTVQIAGEHPEPGPGSEAAGRAALEIAQRVTAGGQLLLLVSGGASALMAAPAEGISLDEKRETTRVLLRAGADIHALNTVRKHLSRVKGGGLAASCAGHMSTLAISDVVGDDLSVIGSGPGVADPSTFAQALAICERFGGPDAYPERVIGRLRAGIRGECPETPKPGDLRLRRHVARVIGGRREAMHGAARGAEARGYRVIVMEDAIVGEARTAGAAHAARVLEDTSGIAGPLCVVSSGETTVTVRGSGRGGRNQEFALAAVEILGRAGRSAALASFGTDGIDGPTNAAGAIVDTQTMSRAARAGLDPGSFLQANNSNRFFSALDDLLVTGPTGTNVGDVQVILLA